MKLFIQFVFIAFMCGLGALWAWALDMSWHNSMIGVLVAFTAQALTENIHNK